MTRAHAWAGVLLTMVVGCGGGGGEASTTTTPEPTPATGTGTATSGGETGAVTTTLPAADDPEWQTKVTHGGERFDRVCATCHGEGGAGDDAPDLRNIHFTMDRMHTQIRNGSGHMRPIPETRLSEADLVDVSAWLTTIGAVDR